MIPLVVQQSSSITKMSHVISIIQNMKLCLMCIELNIWERAKVGIHFNYFVYVYHDNYTNHLYCRYADILCTVWWGAEASMAVSITDYRKIKLGNAGPFGTYPILSVLPDKFARFLFEFHSVDLKVWIYLHYPTTGASSMCMLHLRTIR